MAGKRKSFKASAPVVVRAEPAKSKDLNIVIVVPRNPSGAGVIDLSRWLGHGIDAWVWVCTQQLRVFLMSKSVAANTVVSYAKGGLTYFFEFLISSGVLCHPVCLNLRHIELYVAWLRERPRLRQSSQKNVYAMTKSVLLGLMDRGVIPAGTTIFPRNPYPGINGAKQGQTPLSSGERIRLADALRTDIVAAHTGTFGASDGQMLAVYALALALRTGLNTTPLLELRRDCLKPHPFMPRMRLLETFKRRGNATQVKSLRYTRTEFTPASIPMDGVALLEHLLKRNEALASVAPRELRDAVWLYRAQAMAHRGKLTRLTEPALKYNIRGFVRRHSLVGDDGRPLELTMSRLRKTMENRLWRLSNGDLFTVAAVMVLRVIQDENGASIRMRI